MLTTIATFLTNNYFIENPTEFDNYTMGLYREQLEKITREKIAAVRLQFLAPGPH